MKMKNKILAISIVLTILAATILPMIHVVGAVDITLTLSDAELGTQFIYGWGPSGSGVTITDIPGPGVRFDFVGLGGSGTGVGDQYPVSQLAGGAPDSIGGWGNFQAYTQYRLVFTNLGPNPVSINLMMNTGWTGGGWARDTYWENSWIYVGVGESRIVTLDFSSATCYGAQDDPVPAWRYIGGTSGVIVRRLNEVSHLGFQVCGNGAGSVVVSSTIPKDIVVTLPDEELSIQFAKETGPGTLAAVTDLPGLGVRFDFTGLSSSGTVVGDNFPVSALAGGAWKDYGSGFAGPYDFSGYAKYCLLFINVGTTAVEVNLKMNTGWTSPPWGSPQRDTFWQNSWTYIAPGESRIVTLDFWSAEIWNAIDDPVPAWQYPDGTSGVIVRRLDEVSDIGFQVQGSGVASIIVSGETTLALLDAELRTQFAKETGPGALTTIADVPGPGVKFDFTGLRTDWGTVVGDSFAVSPLAGGAYKTYGVTNPFSTWGDFFEYTKYRMIFTNVGPNPVTVNLKLNTGWTIPPPEYAAAWQDTFWQDTWTYIAPGETKAVTLNFSSAEVWHATDEQEYSPYPDGTTGVTVWRLDEVSDIGFQILGDGTASIIVSARPQCSEVYVDDDYTSSTPGWGYDHFAVVQDGVDAVAIGGIVHVYDGTYVENVNIGKPLTLTAASHPIIDGNMAGPCITIAANGVTVNGFELIHGTYGVASWGTDGSVISNNVVHDILNAPGFAGCGIMFWSDSDDFDGNVIIHNEIYDCDRQGIYIGGETIDFISQGNQIIENTIYSNGRNTYPNLPDASAYGIQLSFADGNLIQGNEIYGHDDWFPWPDYYPDFDFAQGIYLYDSNNNMITNNYLHNNNYGVGIWRPTRAAGTNCINYNDVVGNTGYGVITFDGPPAVDARFNWWGHKSGPRHSSNLGGMGDAIGDNVDYSPWLGFVVGTSPMTWHVNPTGTIQEAIGEASSGDTIMVHEGTYREALYIGKSLTLKAGADPTIEAPDTIPLRSFTGPSGTQNTRAIIFVYGAVDVTIEGFTIDGRGVGNSNYGFIGIQYFEASGTIKDNTIKAIRNTPFDGSQHGVGIVVNHLWDQYYAHSVEINHNTIFDYQKGGIVCNEPGTTAAVTYNTVTGFGPTALIAQNGIQLGWNATGTIEHNEVSGHVYTLYPDWSSAGILLYQYCNGTLVHYNDIHDNQIGVDVYQSSDVVVSYNDIYDNTEYGVNNSPSPVVDARYNWWGDATGPYHPTLNPEGLGDAVSDDVDFIPWLALVHDVAVIAVSALPTTVVAGQTVTVTVMVKNQGSNYENFTVTAYYDSTAIASQNVVNLPPNWNTTLTFHWDTTGMPRGNYVIKAEASIVPGEVDVGDNVFVDGTVEVLWHDVAVIDVVPNRTWVYQGHSVNISVTVENQGDFPETVTVTLYYNITASQMVGTQIINLLPGQRQTIVFTWNTAGVQYCHNYTMTAVATIVPVDNDPADNILDSLTKVKVRILGDLNGDGYVGIDDIFMAAQGFGAEPGDPRWNPDFDMNLDEYVGIDDIFTIANHFGQGCQ
jgi:nitrous oxidase accessory protein NosD